MRRSLLTDKQALAKHLPWKAKKVSKEMRQASLRQVLKRCSQNWDDAKKNESSRHFTVLVSFLQIYNEKVYDLLNPNSAGFAKKELDLFKIRRASAFDGPKRLICC